MSATSSSVGVIGLGYVGLPLAIKFIDGGAKVLGFDIDPSKVNCINSGVSPLKTIKTETVKGCVSKGLSATTDFSRIAEVDMIVICVPTPLDHHKNPDLSFIVDTVNSIKVYLRKGQIISLESTTYPGTTVEVIYPVLVERGFKVGEDFNLVFSPEREDPGNKKFNTRNIPKVIGGYSPTCVARAIAIYKLAIDEMVPVSSLEVAEMAKLLENIHRSVNIGLVNEMKMVCDKMGIDVYEVIRAASTKPFGFVPYYPGPGLGGHCIPVDPFYLTWKAKEFGIATKFIELAGEINDSMPSYVSMKVASALNNVGKAVKGSKILVLGISYKKDVDDTRESPSVMVMELLRAQGADLSYSDPWFSSFPAMREHKFEMKSVEIKPESLQTCDLVLLLTDHTDFDYEMIRKHSRLIVDTRGVYSKLPQSDRINVVVA